MIRGRLSNAQAAVAKHMLGPMLGGNLTAPKLISEAGQTSNCLVSNIDSWWVIEVSLVLRESPTVTHGTSITSDPSRSSLGNFCHSWHLIEPSWPWSAAQLAVIGRTHASHNENWVNSQRTAMVEPLDQPPPYIFIRMSFLDYWVISSTVSRFSSTVSEQNWFFGVASILACTWCSRLQVLLFVACLLCSTLRRLHLLFSEMLSSSC